MLTYLLPPIFQSGSPERGCIVSDRDIAIIGGASSPRDARQVAWAASGFSGSPFFLGVSHTRRDGDWKGAGDGRGGRMTILGVPTRAVLLAGEVVVVVMDEERGGGVWLVIEG